MGFLVSATVTEKMSNPWKYLSSKFAAHIGHIFSVWIVAHFRCNMSLEMLKLMLKGVEELSRRRCLCNNKNGLPHSGIAITQTCIKLTRFHVGIGTTQHFVASPKSVKLLHYRPRPIACDRIESLHMPSTLRNVYVLLNHKNMPQSTGLCLKIIFVYQHAIISPSAASASSITIFTYKA